MNIWRIALGDIRVVLKDRMVLFWWLAMPLGFVFMFSFMMRDWTREGIWLPVFNHDQHELATLFIDQLRSDKYWIDVKPVADQHWIDDWAQALVIPATFSADILAGKSVKLTLTKGSGDPEKLLAAQVQLVRALIKFNGAIAAVDVIEKGWSDDTQAALVAELKKPQQLTVVNAQHFSLRPPATGFAFTLPAYLVMFVMMNSIMFGGITLVYERSGKRLQRLAAAPVAPHEIFLGKMLGRMMQPALQGTVLVLLGVVLFRVNLGDHPLALVPVILVFAFFCGAVGLFFGVLFKTEQQISGLGILTTMVLAGLGGCWWPLEIVPEVFKNIALLTPTYWALQGIHDVMSFGKSWLDVLPECGILAIYGLGMTAIAIPLFRWD